jgi:hypothetical protein
VIWPPQIGELNEALCPLDHLCGGLFGSFLSLCCDVVGCGGVCVLDDAAAFVDLFPSGVDSDGLCANWGEMGDLSSVMGFVALPDAVQCRRTLWLCGMRFRKNLRVGRLSGQRFCSLSWNSSQILNECRLIIKKSIARRSDSFLSDACQEVGDAGQSLGCV